MAVIYRIDHQSTSLGGTTYPLRYGPGLASSLNMSPYTSRMGVKNGTNLWNWEHRTDNGWNGRAYMRYYRWAGVDGDPQCGWYWNQYTVAPPGGWAAMENETFYSRFRIRVQAPLTDGGGHSQMKWDIFGGPGLAQGEARMIMSFRRAAPYVPGATDQSHIAVDISAGVSGDRVFAGIPANQQWQHVQLAWHYGNDATLGGPAFMRIYVNNNVEGSPTAQLTNFGVEIGHVWPFPNIVSDGHWGEIVSSNSYTGTDAIFDVCDHEYADDFDPAWSGGTTPGEPEPPDARILIRPVGY